MSGKENKTSLESSSTPVVRKASANKRKPKRNEGARETFESIAIAFILAFVFKTFQAEAYVIPTGSMAPTLYGRHKEVTCDGCGYEFAIGASTEINQTSGQLVYRISDVFCSNCGKINDGKDAPVYNGDRIVVNKQVHNFNRFDVVVFKNPEQGHVNYIKRLVGLPGESIRIRKGDLWGKTSDDADWEILRKEDPWIQKDIQLTVYDDNYPARPILEKGWPERWAPAEQSIDDGSVGGWKPVETGWVPNREERSYAAASTSKDWQWLRYRHFQPNAAVWSEIDEIKNDVSYVSASLISDFCSFNGFRPPRQFGDLNSPTGTFWVGDLTLNASVDVTNSNPDSAIRLQLVEGPQTFNATVELVSGKVTLTSMESGNPASGETPLASGQGPLMASGRHDVSFANVDDRLCLWIDNQLVEFDKPVTYVSSDQPDPGEADLAPCGIAVRNGEVIVSDLLLQRDIYYQNEFIPFHEEDGLSFYNGASGEVQSERELQSLLTNPKAWGSRYRDDVAMILSQGQSFCEYQLDDDEYLMFGDNSPMSKDSRLFDYQARPMNGIFSHRYAVRQKDLIGKALFIFWPHGVPFLNGGNGIPVWYHKGREALDPDTYPSVRAPFYPNISRMKKIR